MLFPMSIISFAKSVRRFLALVSISMTYGSDFSGSLVTDEYRSKLSLMSRCHLVLIDSSILSGSLDTCGFWSSKYGAMRKRDKLPSECISVLQ